MELDYWMQWINFPVQCRTNFLFSFEWPESIPCVVVVTFSSGITHGDSFIMLEIMHEWQVPGKYSEEVLRKIELRMRRRHLWQRVALFRSWRYITWKTKFHRRLLLQLNISDKSSCRPKQNTWAAIFQNIRFSVADEIKKSAIKVLCSRSLFFLDRKFRLRWCLRSI